MFFAAILRCACWLPRLARCYAVARRRFIDMMVAITLRLDVDIAIIYVGVDAADISPYACRFIAATPIRHLPCAMMRALPFYACCRCLI